MIVLDTNVISELMKEQPDPAVSDWADSVPMNDLWITTICIFEIHYGLNIMDAGRRRTRLVDAFNETLAEDFESRILDFDHESASEAATLAANLRAIGRKPEACDIQIAGIVARFNATLATRNVKDFTDVGVNVINPWDYTP